MLLNGLFPPITTPFYPDGNVYFKKLEHNVERYSRTPIQGIVVLGSTGEAILLSDQERRDVLKAAREAAAPNKVLIAGTGIESAIETLRLTEYAATLGYDVAMVRTPHYYKGQMNRPENMLTFFRTVADRSPLPVIIYNFPQATGYDEAVQQYRRALELDSSNSEAAYGLVIALKKMKDFPLAHERLEAIREDLTRKNLLQSQYMLRYFLTSSRVFLDEGKPDAARSVCDSALDYSTTLSRAPVFRQIAEIDLYERRYEDALDACEEALRMNPNHPDPLFTLAKVYHAKGDSLMTKEISDRLLDFWKNADPDFQGLQELRQVLKTTHPASAPPISSL